MGRSFVRNGTPVGACSLCDSCQHAHTIRGYRETEVLVFCTYVFEQPIAVPFKVRDCSSYLDKNRPNWEQMKALAIDVNPKKCLKTAGFRTIVVSKPAACDEPDEDDEDEESAAEMKAFTG